MGAADVIPFVPLSGISMDEVVELARAFAAELADALGIPVYLYDRAATSPDRASLAEVRKGEFEGLRQAVARGERLPDFGPRDRQGRRDRRRGEAACRLQRLPDRDEDAAKEIARSIRESSGGLPAVRAIGFAVPERGAVTVSMNLVDVDVTSPRVAFEKVRDLAAERGMEVRSSRSWGWFHARRSAWTTSGICDWRGSMRRNRSWSGS